MYHLTYKEIVFSQFVTDVVKPFISIGVVTNASVSVALPRRWRFLQEYPFVFTYLF